MNPPAPFQFANGMKPQAAFPFAKEYDELSKTLKTLAKSEFRDTDTETLWNHLNTLEQYAMDVWTHEGVPPKYLLDVFPHHWKMVSYPLVEGTRKAIRRTKGTEGSASNVAMQPFFDKLVIICTHIINVYGTITISFLRSQNMTGGPLSPQELDDIITSVESLRTTAESPHVPLISANNAYPIVSRLVSRGFIFIGDALRYVVQNVKAELRKNITNPTFNLNGVGERFTLQNVLRMYYIACRFSPGSGNAHNQLAAVFLSLKHNWLALLCYIRAVDTDHPFSSVKGNIKKVHGILKEEYTSGNSELSPVNLKRGSSPTDTAGCLKLQDWEKCAPWLRAIVESHLQPSEERTASEANKVKAAITVKIGHMCCLLLLKKEAEAVPMLETELMSLMYSAGLPTAEAAAPLSPRELFRCVYALQHALFSNADTVPPMGSSTESTGGANSETGSETIATSSSIHSYQVDADVKGKPFMSLDDNDSSFSLWWNPALLDCVHVAYTFCTFALEYVNAFHKQRGSQCSDMDLYFCHVTAMAVVNMATVLRVHLACVIEIGRSVKGFTLHRYTHEGCSMSTEDFYIHYCHVGLSDLVDRMDRWLDGLIPLYKLNPFADDIDQIFSLGVMRPNASYENLLCSSCEPMGLPQCPINCESVLFQAWSFEHHSSKLLVNLENRASDLCGIQRAPADVDVEILTDARLVSFVKASTLARLKAYKEFRVILDRVMTAPCAMRSADDIKLHDADKYTVDTQPPEVKDLMMSTLYTGIAQGDNSLIVRIQKGAHTAELAPKVTNVAQEHRSEEHGSVVEEVTRAIMELHPRDAMENDNFSISCDVQGSGSISVPRARHA